jgi:hypothetical protein
VSLAVLVALGGPITAAGSAGAGLSRSPLTAPAAEQVLVIGVPDLRWTDIDPACTPVLANFLRSAATGVLAVKADGLPTRAAAGWLTLGAGNRMAGVPLTPPATAALTRAAARNARLTYGAQAGALGSALRAAGRTATANGADASVVTAPAPPPAVGDSADLLVAEDRRLYGAVGPARERAAAALDGTLAPLLKVPPPNSGDIGRRVVLLVGMSDGPVGGPALHVAAAAGPGFRAGSLVSGSTRRPPYVQLLDVAPTVLALLGVARPAAMAGTPWRVAGGARSAASLAMLDRQARSGLRWSGTFQTALVWAVLGLAALAWATFRRPRPRAPAVLVGMSLVGMSYALASLPVASYLLQFLPWWRSAAAGLALPVLAAAAAALARAADRCRPGGGIAAISAITVAVLGIDLVTGTHLQTAALLGDSPLIAGRFVGAGNLASALFTASGLVLLGLTCRGRRQAVPLALLAGTAGVVVLGAPQFGADAGGVLAGTPALGVLLLRLADRRVRVRTAALLGLAGGVLLGSAAAADYARPAAEQTHLGRFVGGLLHGGTSGTALRRHLESAAHSVVTSPFNLLLPLAVTLAVAIARGGWRPQRRAVAAVPGLVDGLLAAGVAAILGGLLNDSGIAVPGIAACLLFPLMLAVAAGGQGNAGVDKLGSEVSDAAADSATSAARPRPRLRGAQQAIGPARYQT